MPITNRTLAAGTKHVARYRGAICSLEVIASESGLRFRLDDGRRPRLRVALAHRVGERS